VRRISIHVKLTAWYFVTMAVILVVYAISSFGLMRASMLHALDHELHYKMSEVLEFLDTHEMTTREQFDRAFSATSDSSIVGVFVQITDDHGVLLYESDVLSWHRVPILPPPPADGTTALYTTHGHGWPVRVISKRVNVNGTLEDVRVIEPMRDMVGSFRFYQMYLLLLTPIALLISTSFGFWMSRRALLPVERIRQQAEAIDPSDLTTRLQVPATSDELSRLTITLNAMLGRIERSFRSIHQFTADASHELRAPLAFIITAADVSLRKERTREELTEVLRKISRESKRMAQLVEDLLQLARADAETSKRDLAPVDVCEVLHELESDLKASAAKKNLLLQIKTPETPLHAVADSSDLRRLLVILADNAIKYTEQGSITLSVADQKTELQISVADTGIGIAPDALPHLFERFWRADQVRSRAEGGAGLGLSLAQQIAARNHATITVTSEPEKGSCFTLHIKKSASK